MISIKIRRERTWENGENSGLSITRRGGARSWKPSATRAAGSPVQVWEWLRATLVRKAISNPWSKAQVYNKGQQMLELSGPLGTVQRPCLLWLCRIRRFGKTGCCQLVIYSFAEKYNKSTSTDQKSLWFAVFVCSCWPAQLPTTAQRVIRTFFTAPLWLSAQRWNSPVSCSWLCRTGCCITLRIAFWWWYSVNWMVCEHSCL